jgi:hypothetical protein
MHRSIVIVLAQALTALSLSLLFVGLRFLIPIGSNPVVVQVDARYEGPIYIKAYISQPPSDDHNTNGFHMEQVRRVHSPAFCTHPIITVAYVDHESTTQHQSKWWFNPLATDWG